jgi:phosphoribosylformimino-5-aminoimidazole carboxamide ribotide isomerase
VLLYPAIDMLDGKAVRLHQGHFDESTVYYDDPLAAAEAWLEAGARALHLVDLDGARDGRPANLDNLMRIAAAAPTVPIHFGGGLRDLDAITAVLDAGAERAILGTAAYRDPELLDAALAAHEPERVAVAIDIRDGRVSASGWTERTEWTAHDIATRLRGQGVEWVIYTNADRDGTFKGADLEGTQRVSEALGRPVVASGGIGSLEDLQALRALGTETVSGVVVGKALFERRFDVAAGQATLDGVA